MEMLVVMVQPMPVAVEEVLVVLVILEPTPSLVLVVME
jgi:hypothetical protein